MTATDLNLRLKDLMDGLSVKVFRTYNASITLDKQLYLESTSQTLEQKKADYDLANRDVRFEPVSRGQPLFIPLCHVLPARRVSAMSQNLQFCTILCSPSTVPLPALAVGCHDRRHDAASDSSSIVPGSLTLSLFSAWPRACVA